MLVSAITPGGKPEVRKIGGVDSGVNPTTVLEFVTDFFKNFIPPNMIGMATQKIRTNFEEDTIIEEPVEGMNLLGVIL